VRENINNIFLKKDISTIFYLRFIFLLLINIIVIKKIKIILYI